jgi:hypothetical protein
MVYSEVMGVEFPPIELRDVDTRDKLAELMLYIAKCSEEDSNFGSTRLYKALYYSDFLFYKKTGKSITNASYMRLQHGPAPKRGLPTIEELVSNKDAVMVEKESPFEAPQKRLVALRKADLSVFTAEEISFVDEVLSKLEGRTAKNVSDMTHDIVWQSAENKEEIPYETAFIARGPLSDSEKARGQELAKLHGWD